MLSQIRERLNAEFPVSRILRRGWGYLVAALLFIATGLGLPVLLSILGVPALDPFIRFIWVSLMAIMIYVFIFAWIRAFMFGQKFDYRDTTKQSEESE